jgi:glycosyltransferase involved in cell wall biosynthesis
MTEQKTEEGRPRVLIVTPLDYEKQLNNNEQTRAEQYSGRGFPVTVLYKVMNQSARPLDMLRDTVTCRFREGSDGPVRTVGVDPFFGYFAGLKRSTDEGGSAQGGGGFSLKRLLIRLLSPLAFVRDLFVAPCFLLASLVKLRGRYDMCVGVGPWGGFIGWLLKKTGRVDFLLYLDRDFEPGLVPDRFRQSYMSFLERFAIARADLVISVGELLRALRLEQTGRTTHVIPNGVYFDRFEEARTGARDGSTLIYLGNVIAWSGVELAIRAVKLLEESHPDVRLKIVGGGQSAYVARLAALVEELGLTGRVELLGLRPPEEMGMHLASGDIGLACSEPVPFRRYACPLKVMEYMAAGLPTVVTEDTEAAAIIDGLGAGATTAYETEALAGTLARLLDDPAGRLEMGRRGIEFTSTLTWNDVVDRELELVRALRPDLV